MTTGVLVKLLNRQQQDNYGSSDVYLEQETEQIIDLEELSNRQETAPTKEKQM